MPYVVEELPRVVWIVVECLVQPWMAVVQCEVVVKRRPSDPDRQHLLDLQTLVRQPAVPIFDPLLPAVQALQHIIIINIIIIIIIICYHAIPY